MRQPPGHLRSGLFSQSARVLAALALAVSVAAAAAGATTRWQEPLVTLGEASAEINFPKPTRHAIVLQAPAKVRTLYAGGSILFHPQDPKRSLAIERVTARALVFRQGPRGRRQSVLVGKPIPGFPGLHFTGTVMLDQLHYRLRPVERAVRPHPVLVALEGPRAVLEVDIPRSPVPVTGIPSEVMAVPALLPTPSLRAKLDSELLDRVRVREVSPGLYDVKADDVQAILENTGRVLADMSPLVLPTFSLKMGLQYKITSAAGDGVMNSRGFTVTGPKLAGRAGIEVGDVILSVNGIPVNGFASLYAIYRQVRRDPNLTTVQLELERRASRLTKTYRIR